MPSKLSWYLLLAGVVLFLWTDRNRLRQKYEDDVEQLEEKRKAADELARKATEALERSVASTSICLSDLARVKNAVQPAIDTAKNPDIEPGIFKHALSSTQAKAAVFTR